MNNFKNDNVDIGVLIGVIGVDGEAGSIRWLMISDDEVQPVPTTYDSDTCYYFSDDKLFTHKEFCTSGITPRGVLQNLNGFNFDLEFRFSDPALTPRTLTIENIKDSLGNWLTYGSTDEPLLNEALIMSKEMIFARLVESIPNQSGGYKLDAFDVHLFAPWSLYNGSFGWDAPFDYSTKNWIQNRKNILFITDPGVGSDVVGHNYRNFGNFLWGAATYIMGVPQWMALSGAHLNNLVKEPSFSFDSPDDQYAIKLGRYYAKVMEWKTIYGGKNNIFRQ